MATSPMSVVIQHLLTAVGRDGAGMTDGELLSRFLKQRDDAALATLIERHAPMVWGVCRRLLRSQQDAEDAFQATFLVLVRKATAIRDKEMVANWLYGVARQTSVRLRATTAKRGMRERQVVEMPEPIVAEGLENDLLPLLDQELSRLPEKFRVLIVLCDLEGKTRKEAARQLGCPEGTVASRLARARGMLAKRMARHGLAVSGGSLAAVLSQNMALACVPTAVVSSTIRVATLFAAGKAAGVISIPVATLTKGILKTMFVSKLKTATAVLFVVFGLVAFGGGILLITNSVKAIPWLPFTDTTTHVEKAKDIVIAECLTDNPGLGIDGIAPYDVKVVAVIQGDRKLGKLRVGSDGLVKGRTYMLTGFGGSLEKVDFLTNGELAVVELPPKFDIGSLEGKTPSQQVQAVFDARRIWVDARLRALHLEKERLDRTKKSGDLAVGQAEEKPARIENPMGQPPMAEQKPTNPMTEKKPMDTAPEKKRVHTPDEAIRMAEDSKLTVEFKVQFVTKAILIKSEDNKDAGWANGHSPEDICLRPQHPTDRKQARFLAILTEKTIKQFNRVGIQDIEKHFSGKIVRVTGRISRADYDGYGTPSEVEIVIDDLSQLEVVN